MAIDLKYGKVTVEREPGNPINGTDEPVFVMRARDNTAVQILMAYRGNAQRNGAPEGLCAMVDQTIQQFMSWQSQHTDLVKIPD